MLKNFSVQSSHGTLFSGSNSGGRHVFLCSMYNFLELHNFPQILQSNFLLLGSFSFSISEGFLLLLVFLPCLLGFSNEYPLCRIFANVSAIFYQMTTLSAVFFQMTTLSTVFFQMTTLSAVFFQMTTLSANFCK